MNLVQLLNPEIEVVRLRESAFVPKRQSKGAAGFDLYADIDTPVTLWPDSINIIPTGVAVHISNPNIVGLVTPRSGLARKFSVRLANSVGVIDSDYQGEIKLLVHRGTETAELGPRRFIVEPGMRIAQIIFLPVSLPHFIEVTKFSEKSERGKGGFGSTGI